MNNKPETDPPVDVARWGQNFRRMGPVMVEGFSIGINLAPSNLIHPSMGIINTITAAHVK